MSIHTVCVSCFISGSYVGCFEDAHSGVNRTLNEVGETSDTNSVTFCRDFCTKRGYKFAGMKVI